MTDASTARPVLSGRYELHRRIARGGMADVFLARDQLLDRPVAVKVLFPQYAAEPTFVARFRREAQAAANLNHPSVVAVYDWGSHGDTYFIVMEYVEGRSLADILAAEGHLYPDRSAEIAADVAAALGFAHRNGTVHRDVKPGNIMITPSGQVKVTDFGIARAFGGEDDELTQTGSVMGTASYFSPEQAQGRPVDPRSDLYSLGVVLFEMVTGEPPFTGASPVSIAYKHVQEQPPLASSLNPAVPPALDAIINRLLAKNPDQRYASAEDVRADLRRFREGQPVVGASLGGFGGNPTNGGGPSLYGRPPAQEVAPTRAMARPPDTGAARAVIDTTRAIPASAAGRMGEPVEEYYEPPSRTGVFVVMLAALLLLLVGLIFLVTRGLKNSGGDPSATTTVAQVTVPNVVGEDRRTAIPKLQDAGFVVQTQFEPAPSSQFTTDMVFDQTPKGDAKAAPNSTVTIHVAQAETTIQVPNVVNQSSADATKALQAQGLTITIQKEASDTVKADVVIRQTPDANQKVNPGTAVVLVVSSGPKSQTIPSLAGQTTVNATQQLKALGFTNLLVQEEPSLDVPAGSVTRTDPAANSSVDLGTKITVFVAKAPDNIAVPSVVGLTQVAATQQLGAKGFVPQVQFVDLDQGNPNIGLVVNQTPRANDKVPSGTEVLIEVGRAKAGGTTTTSTTNQSGSTTSTTK